jgi:hypothetical protein
VFGIRATKATKGVYGMVGRKDDTDKLKWSLMPWEELEDATRVLMAGAKKYGEENWKRLDKLNERYADALVRHAVEYQKGQRMCSDFNLPTLAHVICCALFCMWGDNNLLSRKEDTPCEADERAS